MRAKFGTSPSWRLAAVLCLTLVLVMIGASTAFAITPKTTIAAGGKTVSAGPTYFSGEVQVVLSSVDASGSKEASGNVLHGIAWTKYIDGAGGLLFGTEQDAVLTSTDESHSVSNAIKIDTPGYHYFSFYSADGSGNVEAVNSVQIVIVGLKPIATADIQPSYVTSASIPLSAISESAATMHFKLDGGTQIDASTVQCSTFGTHTVEFWATAGGLSSDHVVRGFEIIDAAAPTTSCDATGTYEKSATINLSATDASPGVGVDKTYYRIDPTYEKSDWTAGTSATTDVHGDHKIEFYSVDKSGNAEAVKSATFKVNNPIETDPPTTTSDAKGSYTGTQAVVVLTSIDKAGGSGMAKLEWKVDNGAVQSVSAPAARAQATYPNGKTGPWIPLYAKASTLILATHSGGPGPGLESMCPVCHNMIASPDITQAQNDAGVSSVTAAGDLPHATQACANCHTVKPNDTTTTTTPPPPTGNGSLSATVTVPGTGSHSIEFWGTDKAGNAEAHKTVNFIVTNVVPVQIPTIGIATTASTVKRGRQFILSGAVTPVGMVGKMVVAWVKKPGKTYWTYSSNRIVYAKGTGAAWQYKYTTLAKMALGTYSFKCTWSGNASFTKAASKTIAIRLVR